MRRPIAEAVSLTDAVPRELKSTTISVDDLVLDRDHAYVIVSNSVRLGRVRRPCWRTTGRGVGGQPSEPWPN